MSNVEEQQGLNSLSHSSTLKTEAEFSSKLWYPSGIQYVTSQEIVILIFFFHFIEY